jgi:single-strand DNA-binding protein
LEELDPATKARKTGRIQMVSFNRVVLAGNLTRDPELRFTQNGVPVSSFSIAVNRVRSKSEAVDFFNVSAWRELGETVVNYKKKGDPLLVEGRLQYRTWQAQDGAKRSTVDVVADRVQFLDRGTDPQARAEEETSAEISAETADEGGWGGAKQLQEEKSKDIDSKKEDASKEEDFDDIPF